MATGTFERTMNTVAYGVVGAVAARHTANGLAFELSAEWRRRVTLEAVAGGYTGYKSGPARLAALLGERRAARTQVENSPIDRGEQERLKTEVDAVVRAVLEDLDGQVQAGITAAAARLELAVVTTTPDAGTHANTWARFQRLLDSGSSWGHVVNLAASATDCHVLAAELPLYVGGSLESAPDREQTMQAVRDTVAERARAFMSPAQLKAQEDAAALAQQRTWWVTNVANAKYELDTQSPVPVIVGMNREILAIP